MRSARRDYGRAMSRHKYLDHLREVPMFADLGHDELELIAQAATEVTFGAGTTLIREGATAREMVVVLDGELEVTREGEHVAYIGAGGFAGELSLLAHTRRHSSVTAHTDVTLLHIDGRSFGPVLEGAPQIAVKMLPIVAGRAVDNAADHTY